MTATVTPSLLSTTYNFKITVKDCPEITAPFFTLVGTLTNPFTVYKSGTDPNQNLMAAGGLPTYTINSTTDPYPAGCLDL